MAPRICYPGPKAIHRITTAETSVRGRAIQDQIARTEINLVAPSASLFLPDLGGIDIRFSQDVIIIVITVIGQSGDGVVIVVIVNQLVDFT